MPDRWVVIILGVRNASRMRHRGVRMPEQENPFACTTQHKSNVAPLYFFAAVRSSCMNRMCISG